MRLRFFFFAVFLFAELSSPTRSQCQTWHKVAQIANMGRVSACYFFDENTGIIGFDQISKGSPLLHTTDGGVTWQAVSTPIVSIRWTCDIWFKNSLEGWATFIDTGEGGILWHSIDGGLSWSPVVLTGEFKGVRATPNALIVTSLVDPGIFVSSNGGATFYSENIAMQNGIDFVDNLHGATGDYFSKYAFSYTTDGGKNWLPAAGPRDECWGVLGIQGTGTFFAVSEIENEILRSTDFGVTWNSIYSLSVNGSIAIGNNGLYVQTMDEGLFSSSDTGKSWINFGGPSNGRDCAIAVFSCMMYAFDAYGGIWKSSVGQPFKITEVPLNFGTLMPCEAHDTIISIINTECAPITLSSCRLSQPAEGYIASASGSTPISIPGGDTTFLHITFDGTHTGRLLDTVLVGINASTDSIWRIPIQTMVPPIDSVNLSLQTVPSVTPGQHFHVDVVPDRIVDASKGLTSVSGRISYYENAYQFDSITAAPGFQFQKNGPFQSNGLEFVDFSISNSNGIALDPSTPIVQIWLESMLTDSGNNSIQLDSVLLNGNDPSFSQCLLAYSSIGISPQRDIACGDNTILHAMGHDLFTATLPWPNPGSILAGDCAQIRIEAAVAGVMTVDVSDALGRSYDHENYSLPEGARGTYTLGSHITRPGSYFYAIRFESALGDATQYGSILLLH